VFSESRRLRSICSLVIIAIFGVLLLDVLKTIKLPPLVKTLLPAAALLLLVVVFWNDARQKKINSGDPR
jgi:hypothetical protein